jgi:hypothetical protein
VLGRSRVARRQGDIRVRAVKGTPGRHGPNVGDLNCNSCSTPGTYPRFSERGCRVDGRVDRAVPAKC